jgi:hypothetical protein
MLTADAMVQRLQDAGHFCAHDAITDEKGAAFLLVCSTRTLSNWRNAGAGPPAVKTSRWLYDIAELAAWYNAGGKNR